MRVRLSNINWIRRAGALVAVVVFMSGPAAAGNGSTERHEILSRATISLPQAMRTAETVADGGYVIGGELQEKQGMFYYEIDVLNKKNKSQIYINPANGLVVGRNVTRSLVPFGTSNQTKFSTISRSRISLPDAIALALARFAGIVREANLKESLVGGYVYRIDVIIDGAEHEIVVDPVSGEIVDSPTK